MMGHPKDAEFNYLFESGGRRIGIRWYKRARWQLSAILN
jgi:hypothetical protein